MERLGKAERWRWADRVLSGHIVGTATVSDIERDENRRRMTFSAPSPWLKYVFEKGYVAVNGASLDGCCSLTEKAPPLRLISFQKRLSGPTLVDLLLMTQ